MRPSSFSRTSLAVLFLSSLFWSSGIFFGVAFSADAKEKCPSPRPNPSFVAPVIENAVLAKGAVGEGYAVKVSGKNFLQDSACSKTTVSFTDANGAWITSTILTQKKDGEDVPRISSTEILVKLPETAVPGPVKVEISDASAENRPMVVSNGFSFIFTRESFVKPVITNIIVDKTPEGKYVVSIGGENFLQDAEFQKIAVQFIDEDGQKTTGTNVAVLSNSKITTDVPATASSGSIVVEIDDTSALDRALIASEPYPFSYSRPNILYLFSKEGLRPDGEAFFHGEYLSLSGSATKLLWGTAEIALKESEVSSEKIRFEFPPFGGKGDFVVEIGGLKSNVLKFEEQSAPILQDVRVFEDPKATGDDKPLQAEIFGYNIPDEDEQEKYDAAPTIQFGSASAQLVSVSSTDLKNRKKILVNLPATIYDEEIVTVSVAGVKSNAILWRQKDEPLFASTRIKSSKDKEEEEEEEEEFADPYIIRIEGKYSFHAGAPFTIIGNGFGYERSGISISGMQVDPNSLEVTNTRIDGEFTFKGIADGEGSASESLSYLSVYVSRDGKKSNTVSVPFGATEAKVAYAAPRIVRIDYLEGHLPGDSIKIHGSGFSQTFNQNLLTIGGKKVDIDSVNKDGTVIEFVIPSDMKSGDLIVSRLMPEEQKSDAQKFIISDAAKKTISLGFLPIEGSEVKTPVAVKTGVNAPVAVIGYENSKAEAVIEKLKIEVKYASPDPGDPMSPESLKILPLSRFTLHKGSEEIAGPVFPSAESGKFYVEFTGVPLAISEDGASELIMKADISSFLQDKSTISFSLPSNTLTRTKLYTIDFTGDRKEVSLSEVKTPLSPEIEISNPEVYCVDSDEYFRNCKPVLDESGIPLSDEENALYEKAPEEAGEEGTGNETDSSGEGPVAPVEAVVLIDTDGDGVSDEEELKMGLDPKKSDTDGDGIDDRTEILAGKSPRSTNTDPLFIDFGEAAWATEYITVLYLQGAIVKPPKGVFRPNEKTRRSDFINMAVEAFRTEPLKTTSEITTPPFPDVPPDYLYAPQILYAKEKGIINGRADGTFGPEEYISRVEALKILLSFLSLPPSTQETSSFPDVLEKWKIEWVEAGKAIGIIKGYGDGTFRPDDAVTRAESTKIIVEGVRYLMR